MAKKYVMLILVSIVMAFFTGPKITADEITDYYMDVPKKPLQVMEDLYKSVLLFSNLAIGEDIHHGKKICNVNLSLYSNGVLHRL